MYQIRRLEPSETAPALAMVQSIFFDEQGVPKELAPIDPAQDPHWWGVLCDGTLCGTLASYVQEGRCHIGRLTISSDHRGRHLASRLISLCLSDLFAMGYEQIDLDARDATVHIITGLGGVITGEAYPFYVGNCTPMIVTRDAFHPLAD